MIISSDWRTASSLADSQLYTSTDLHVPGASPCPRYPPFQWMNFDAVGAGRSSLATALRCRWRRGRCELGLERRRQLQVTQHRGHDLCRKPSVRRR
jgi:hypothetical protein